MIKIFVATGFVCLSVGSAIGYTISEAERQIAIQSLNLESKAIVSTPKATPLNRKNLEARLIACIGRAVNLERFSDKDLNDELFQCELERSKR